MPQTSGQISCAPPGGPSGPYTFGNFLSGSIAFTATGAVIASVFPLAARVATLAPGFPGAAFSFPTQSGLIACSLASSILNQHAGDTVAVALAVDRGPVMTLAGGTGIFAVHQALPNSSATTANANSRGTGLDFGNNSYFSLGSGQQIALYACSANDAANLLSATGIFWWISLP